MLNPHIDNTHRAAKLEGKKLKPLVTRTPKENWRIHPDWVQRYVCYSFLSRMYIIQHSHPEEIPAPTTWDTYPSYDTSGSRQHAVNIHFLCLIHLIVTYFAIYI